MALSKKPTNSAPLLTRKQFKEANKAVTKVLEWEMMVQQVLRSIFSQSQRKRQRANLATRISIIRFHILKSHVILL